MGIPKDKARGGIKLKKELLVASAVSVLLVISGIVHLPPLSFLLDLNAVVKDAWVGSKDEEPPFGHAELLAPEVFCAKVDIAYPEAKAVWEAAGIVGLDSAESLDGLARMNDSSPIALYRLIKHLEKSPVSSTGQRFEDAEAVQRAFGGTGIGNKSIEDLAARVGQPSVDLRARLKARGIELGPDESLKQAASRLDKQPLQLLEAALVELKTE